MKRLLHLSIEEICRDCEISVEEIEVFIQESWITPADKDALVFDEEDLARIDLIQELRRDLGVNDDAIPIILNLLDQLHLLRQRIRKIV